MWEFYFAQRDNLIFFSADRKYDTDKEYLNFRRQLFHSGVSGSLESLLPGMRKCQVMKCPDGHMRRVILGLGPYIADYPEQAQLACVLNGWCPQLVESILDMWLSSNHNRCLSKPDSLDDISPWREREHDDKIVAAFDAKYLGDTYGVVKNVVVSIMTSLKHNFWHT